MPYSGGSATSLGGASGGSIWVTCSTAKIGGKSYLKLRLLYTTRQTETVSSQMYFSITCWNVEILNLEVTGATN